MACIKEITDRYVVNPKERRPRQPVIAVCTSGHQENCCMLDWIITVSCSFQYRRYHPRCRPKHGQYIYDGKIFDVFQPRRRTHPSNFFSSKKHVWIWHNFDRNDWRLFQNFRVKSPRILGAHSKILTITNRMVLSSLYVKSLRILGGYSKK